MNWAKGRATKGRGTSFKGALRYVLHDKEASTAERVGFVEMRNLATDDPHQAWLEMMTLCEAANDLKRRAGEKTTGNKLKKPVYAFTLNWHELDQPKSEHMRQTAEDALRTLGMEDLQAVIVEHTDRPHRHVHVVVNLVHPDTGKAVSLSNDEHKLDRWADRYEVAQGVIRSPDRRAKFEALEQGRQPPKRKRQASSREEWQATKGTDPGEARRRADAIRTTYATRVTRLKEQQNLAFQQRLAEGDRLWKRYRADLKAIRDRYQPFIDAIYKSKRKAAPHPATEQARRDLQDSAEWRDLGRQQFSARRAFSARDRHALGAIANAIRLHVARRGEGGLRTFFVLAISPKRRRSAFDDLQQREKQALGDRQRLRRNARANALRAACRHEIAQQAMEFSRQRKLLVSRHAGEIAAQKVEWRELAAERTAAWSSFEREFGADADRKTHSAGVEMREHFSRAASGRSRRKGEGRGEGEQSQSSAPLSPNEEKRGWRARRKAAERKADGSYKSRGRGGKDPGRTRRPTR